MVKSMKSLIGSTPIHDSQITIHFSPSPSFPLTIESGVSCYPGFSRSSSRSQAITLDWNARLNDYF
jgi:hypothetical protein